MGGPPYELGDSAVWLDPDPAGMRVSKTSVLGVHRDGAGWSVETPNGREWVNARGEGSKLIPLDNEIEHDFQLHGTSFVVPSTVDKIVSTLDPSLDWERFEVELDPERDGPEHEL